MTALSIVNMRQSQLHPDNRELNDVPASPEVQLSALIATRDTSRRLIETDPQFAEYHRKAAERAQEQIAQMEAELKRDLEWLKNYIAPRKMLEVCDCMTCTASLRNIKDARSSYLQARAENNTMRKNWARQNWKHFRGQFEAHLDEKHGGG